MLETADVESRNYGVDIYRDAVIGLERFVGRAQAAQALVAAGP